MREVSLNSQLLGCGIAQLERAKQILVELKQACPGLDTDKLLEFLQLAADPDAALLNLSRLVSIEGEDGARARFQIGENSGGERLVRLLGASRFYGDFLMRHPEYLGEVESGREPVSAENTMLKAVAAEDKGSAEYPLWVAGTGTDINDLRREYYRCVMQIAIADLIDPNPSEKVLTIGKQLSDLVDATLEALLALARREHDDIGKVRLCVIAMGKTGAQELNYISDVDVIFVVAPGACGEEIDEVSLTQVGTQLASEMVKLCSVAGSEPNFWTIDTALRPEGRDGALVRTVASHLEYYHKWAKSWEFQALLKARAAAGDLALGEEYVAGVTPLVWSASEREGFVDDARAMRRRVEVNIPAPQVDRELKLGWGGLRDVEFTVQLLQLVHGRIDETLRVPGTLDALEALSRGGYIGRDHAQEMGDCYRNLRLLEHRIQLYRMRRTHLVPEPGPDLTRIGRSINPREFKDGKQLEEWWQKIRVRVRQLHEDIFYRPLLPALAGLSAAEASLSEEAASERLAAIGYRDPKGAIAHITALTEGVTRRAAIQRQLLPVLLGWFADGADPDAGLLAFRDVSETIGDSHWYLRLLRDSGAAATRLAKLLPNSPFVSQALTQIPEAVRWLDEAGELEPRSRETLEKEILAVVSRQEDVHRAADMIREQRKRELVRAATLDVLEGIEVERSQTIITPAGETALAAALHLALGELRGEGRESEPEELFTRGLRADHLIVAMGRLGGSEAGYASDADVMFVYRALPGENPDNPEVNKEAQDVARMVSNYLGSGANKWEVDSNLRPEGKSGPITRSLDSYAEYYRRWASAWEAQALLRARPIAGNQQLGEDFVKLIDPIRYGDSVGAAQLREIRRLKARMESERLPRGVRPNHHVKLGPGGLADVEWTVQLLQLKYSHEYPELRDTGTLSTLKKLVEVNLLTAGQEKALEEAWTMATKIRAANVLGLGRTSGAKLDQLPAQPELTVIAELMGYQREDERDLIEDYMRAARRARAVVDEVFWE